MNIRLFIGTAALCIAAPFLACNDGLRPDESIVNVVKPPVDTSALVKKTGFSGNLTFRGKRPAIDSLLSLRVVALYRKYPLDSLTAAYFSGELTIGDTLSRSVDTASYFIAIDTLKIHRYAYIAVAQQFSTIPAPFGNWRAVGVYAPSGNDSLPGFVDVIRDSVIKGININVDFDHLPPQ